MTDSDQLAFWPAEAVAPRTRGLLISGDHADLQEPFLFEPVPGVWVAAQWKLTPKLATDGWWFPHWWNGPRSRRWTGTDGDVPEEAARFPTAAAAVRDLAIDQLESLAEFPCHRSAHYLAVTGCRCATRSVVACKEHVPAACYSLARACTCEPDPQPSVSAITTPAGKADPLGRRGCSPLPVGIEAPDAAGTDDKR
jgi:hypothetical protein